MSAKVETPKISISISICPILLREVEKKINRQKFPPSRSKVIEELLKLYVKEAA